MKPRLTQLLFFSTLAALALPAQAVGLCSTGQATGGISTSDMTFSGTNASDCYGLVAGNLNPAQAQALVNNTSTAPGSVWGGGWTYLAKDEGGAGTGSYQGLNFTLDATAGTSGTWTLSASDTNGTDPLNLPATLDFVSILKAGPNLGLWYFDDVTVNASNTGTYEISFLNPGGQIPNLSHMDLLVRGNDNEVPEPDGLALLGISLLGLVAFRRRRSA